MKWKDVFIGCLVQDNIDDNKVGKVVDIKCCYDYNISYGMDLKENFPVPVVHFIGESLPRKINVNNIKKFVG